MDNSGYTAVVAVRKHKATPNSQDRFNICRVPAGIFVDKGEMVFYGATTSSECEKGVCVSDTRFVDPATLEMLMTVTQCTAPLREVKARVIVDWFSVTETDAKRRDVDGETLL